MKFSKFILAFAASFLILSQAGAATIVGNLMDIYGGGIDRTIKISPKSTPQAVIYNGTNYTVMDLAKTVSSTNSVFAVVLLGGIYNVDFGTVNGVATPVTKILVPPYDTNTYSFNYVANLATNLGTFVWTNSYGIAAGTNIVITTNGALLVINSAGAGTIYATNVSGLGTAAYSNATAFAASSVTNLNDGQLSTIAAAITNGQTGANLGYTVFTNSKYQALGAAPNSIYLNAGAGFNTANNFLGNTNYPEAQNTNMGIVFSPVVDNDNYLGATNSLGNIPRFLKFWWRYQDDIRYNTNLAGAPSAASLFKISKDLTDNGNDYVEAYNDLVVDRDLRVSRNIINTSNVNIGGELYVTNHAYDVSTSRLDPLANEFVTAEYVQSVMAANFDLYFSTNTSGITVTNGSGGLFIPSTMVLVNPTTSQTNTISSFTNGTYFTARLQTNSISYIQSVPINLYTYVQITGGGSVTAHPEMWLYNTNGTIVQLGYSSDNTYSSDIAVPVNLAIAMTNTAYLNVNLTNSPQLLLRWYVTSTTGNPTWKFLIGAGNVSHITVGTIPSANQNYVGTFTGNGSGLTNIPATGIVGTAVTNNASPTFTGLSVGAQTALDVNGNGKFGGVGHTNGVLTGNGSGITNVSASLPSGTASLAIGSLTLTNAITIKTNSTIPTLVQNVNTTCIPSSFIDPTSNDGLIILSYLAAAGTTMPPNSNYFTITLSQPATSTNSLIVIPTANVTLPASGQTIAANSSLNRYNVFASSNSFILASGTSVPPVGMTNQLIFLQVYRR